MGNDNYTGITINTQYRSSDFYFTIWRLKADDKTERNANLCLRGSREMDSE